LLPEVGYDHLVEGRQTFELVRERRHAGKITEDGKCGTGKFRSCRQRRLRLRCQPTLASPWCAGYTVSTMERAIPSDAAQASGIALQALTRQMVRMAVSACHAFLDWERSEMMGAEPTPQTQAQHRPTLLRLLRLMRRLHAEATEPEYADRTAAAEVEAVLWKL